MLDCLRCPSDPWVVLAEIEVDSDGSILRIDNCSCRRIVVSLAMVWGTCETRIMRCQVDEPNPSQPLHAASTVSFVVSGENFPPSLDVDLGQGVDISDIDVTNGGQSLTFVAHIRPGAALGPRDLIITAPDCTTATCADALVIVADEDAGNQPRGRRRGRRSDP
jgi:hypothetical protein